MSIKDFFAIILKLLGLLFIVYILVIIIPNQCNFLFFYDHLDVETKSIGFLTYPIAIILINLLLLFFVYNLFIVRTKFLISLLRGDHYFGDRNMDISLMPLEKYA